MRHIYWRWIASVCLLPVGLAVENAAIAQSPITKVRHALDEMHRWVGTDANGRAWRRYLKSDQLELQLAKGDDADWEQLNEVLERYNSSANGLDRTRFVAVRVALQQWLDQLARGERENLLAMVQQAKQHFEPRGSAPLERAERELRQAIDQLDRLLAASGPEKQRGWKAYLQWEQMLKQLNAPEGPDLRVLRTVAGRYRGDYAGLERARLVAVRESLWEYIYAAYLASRPNLKKDYQEQLDLLAQQLKSYAQEPTGAKAAAIGQIVGWLEHAHQAGALVRAVRRHYAHSNLFGSVSERLLAAAVQREVDATSEVSDVILGTDIHGTARTRGRVGVELVPSDQAAVLDLHMVGISNSDNVGYQGSVTLYSTGTTEVDVRKRVLIDAGGVRSVPAAAHCTTSTCTHGIDAPPIVRWLAARRAAQSKGQAEWIAARHAEDRFERRMDRQSAEALREANEDFLEKLRWPLVRRRAFPSRMQFRSTADALQLEWRQAGTFQLAAPGPPPAMPEGLDLALTVHQSFFSNLSEAGLGGDTLSDKKLARLIKDLTGEVPEELRTGPDQEPWSITFRSARPISVVFREGEVGIAVRGARFQRADQAMPRAMEISATYKIEKTADGVRLTRQGDVQAKYLRQGRESIEQIAIKTFMRKKFAALFRQEIVSEDLQLPERWRRAGTLHPQQVVCGGGWLSIGWRRSAPASRTAARPARSLRAAANGS